MAALCSIMFVVSLNTFITMTAVRTIALNFDISDCEYAWIGSACLLAFCSVVPVGANISQVFGRRGDPHCNLSFFLYGVLIVPLSQSVVVQITGVM